MRKTTRSKSEIRRFFERNGRLILSSCAIAILFVFWIYWFSGYKSEQEDMAKQTRKELGMDSVKGSVVSDACVSSGVRHFEQSGLDVNIIDQATEIHKSCAKNAKYYD